MRLTTRQLLEKVVSVDSTDVMSAISAVVKEQIFGKGLATDEIAEILNGAGEEFEVVFQPKLSQNLSLNSDELAANLSGGGTLEDGTIVVFYDPSLGLEEVFENDFLMAQFLTAVRNVIEHELVHREQLDRAEIPIHGDDPYNVVKYLSNPAEIMAMARQAVNQFLDAGYAKEQIFALLRSPWRKVSRAPDRSESDVFWNYTEWFDGKDPVFQKFVKFMVGYLTQDTQET